MIKRDHGPQLSLAMVLALGVWASPEAARAAAPAEAQDQAATRFDAGDDIVVTARRTAESLQSVPVSISAISAEGLREKSIKTLEDIQIATPGVNMAAGNRQNVNITIRGQSKALAGVSSPAVLSYFADVPSPTYGSFIPQFDLSSVQVLKGPQGTLFGRNTTGGAVLFTPQAPTADLEGYAMAGYGNFDNQQFEAVVNVPLGDRFRVRVGGSRQIRDGFAKDINHPDHPIDDIDDYTLRGSVWFEPVDGLTNLTIVDYYKSDTGGEDTTLGAVYDGTTLLTILGLQGPLKQALADQKARGIRNIANQNELYTRSSRLGITNNTQWEFGNGLKLVNIFGYRYSKLEYTTNSGVPRVVADGTGAFPAGIPVDLITAQLNDQTRQYTEELQLHGSAWNDRIDWLVGGFYFKSKPAGAQGQSVAFAETPLAPFTSKGAFAFTSQTSKAVFGHVSMKLDDIVDGLQLEAGGRHTWDKQTTCTGTGPTVSSADVEPSECLTRLTNPASVGTQSKAFTWSLGLNWQATEDLFAYIVTRKGYRAGGTNSPIFGGRLTQFQTFSPETVQDVEGGIRSDIRFADNLSLRFNISGFIGWYKNVQSVVTGVQTAAAGCDPGIDNPVPISPDGDCNVNNDPSGGTVILNLGRGRVSGIDLDGSFRIGRALTLNFGAAFLDPKTTSYSAPGAIAPYVTEREIPFNFTADRTITLGGRFVVPVDESVGEVALNADFYSTSSTRYSGTRFPGYELVNARAEWRGVFGSNFDLSVYARNLFNKTYAMAINASGAFIGLATYRYGLPRTYGLELRYNF